MRVGPVIATRAFGRKADSALYRIRVEFLDDGERSVSAEAMEHFAIPKPVKTPQSDRRDCKESRRRADIMRAIAAAEKAGLQNYRMKVDPDGVITIVIVALPPEEHNGPDIDAMAP